MDRLSSPGKSALALLITEELESDHEAHVRRHLAEQLAGVLGLRFTGVRHGRQLDETDIYVIPDATLVTPQPGIRSDQDLYGGVVARPFMASKAISHPLISSDAAAPDGWTERFMELAGDVVLPGYSAFNLDDALRAGAQLLQQGPIRVKVVQARAGRGQQVIHAMPELEKWLAQQDASRVRQDGVVLEVNLTSVRTFSVGQLRIGGMVISYFGCQNLTDANDGTAVYGGSDLWLVRGDYTALLREIPDPVARQLIHQAHRYEQAAEAAFPGFIASRRNCDVAVGRDPSGQQRSGVLEQSWRIGGASSAEVYALLAFVAEPALQRLQASSCEIYGEAPVIPPDVTLLYQGDASATGPITIGVRVTPWQQPVITSN
ncbi:DUF3182 family protein [Halopseudomonas bauzanensis]|uniref:DUF3182 family protein n=1 Tax=Halopseudomonas bauzanensis TaxID=653930 RepID=A0A1H9Q288_9GAMM|nr:DUF3182 family protein [Halopseudomonas bauzanensis]TKA90691.1 DUF3182 family protein [Halopseudomonas bauzanensis]SER54528.1 Protein of unknown function [Halopseudomonas bauzanensis]SFL69492.1 Protein of unknown function [Halopseudomonas bauzanensis]